MYIFIQDINHPTNSIAANTSLKQDNEFYTQKQAKKMDSKTKPLPNGHPAIFITLFLQEAVFYDRLLQRLYRRVTANG